MTNKLKYHKNYTEFGEPYQLVLPLNLEGLIPDDDSVRLLSHELEDLDYSLLYQAYSAKGRNPAVDPKTMFKILTYAYSQNIYSSRKIERACKRDINFMWLLAGQKAQMCIRDRCRGDCSSDRADKSEDCRCLRCFSWGNAPAGRIY